MSKIPSDSNHAFTIISGAGMSGITLAVHLLKLKVLNLHELHIFDQNDNYGGAWAANTYPGCACDVPSHGYQMRYWLNPSRFLLTNVAMLLLTKYIQLGP
jgi:cation diffusion facilitator CzcD-associated flavoprotein CzcO